MPRKKFNKITIPRYTEQQLMEAISKVESNELSIRVAAFNYGVPRSTIQFRIKNPTAPLGTGATTILSRATELLLVHILVKLSDWGFGRRFVELQSIVCEYLKKTDQSHLFKKKMPGRDWYFHFLNRWKVELSERAADNIASLRAASCTTDIIDFFFANCKRNYEESGVSIRPENVWNVDETNQSGDQGKVKIICRKGAKRPLVLTGNNEKIGYTVNNCCNAAGTFLPPFVVYKSKKCLHDKWMLGGPPGTVYTTSPSG